MEQHIRNGKKFEERLWCVCVLLQISPNSENYRLARTKMQANCVESPGPCSGPEPIVYRRLGSGLNLQETHQEMR